MSIPSWHLQLPLHETSAITIIAFLKATTPTPVYGTNNYKFRFIGSSREADALRNQLRVALTRIRNKAKRTGVAVYPFTMIVSEPETHTIVDETFHVITLSRRVDKHNPFDHIIDARTVLAVADREHPPTKRIAEMLEELANTGTAEVDVANWSELSSAMWLVAHDYAKPTPHDYNKGEIRISGCINSQVSLWLEVVNNIRHINPSTTTASKKV